MNSMSFLFAILYLTFSLCLVLSIDYCYDTNRGQCPQKEYFLENANTSCICSNDRDIDCTGTKNLDLIFATMTNQIHHSIRFFDNLIIRDCTPNRDLKTNLFDGIKFKKIEILNCFDVTKYSPHIFGGTSDTVENLNLELYKYQNDTDLSDFWADVFHSIGHLPELKRLKIARFNTMIIPELALKALSSSSLKITDIHFNNAVDNNNNIESIGKDAFNDLVNLATLDFSETRIGFIKEFAFRSIHSLQPLTLTLTAEQLLKMDFEANSLKGSKRVIQLYINSLKDNIDFYLNQTYLKPFFDEKKENLIIIEPSINCNEQFLAQNRWIIKEYNKQIFGKCFGSGIRLTDLI